ncbi:uncharacterized protein LOC101862761 [Aplysia californica]|uniref:Uncharacterized protein LOC101862761 n=1 Tax=Aplysia californica TaxID=6500 RepID=A0ABM0K8I3_APLCA|nr:uncharacterized protein LOC101862761 [Aplysia californica]
MAPYYRSNFMGISPFLLLFLLGYCLAVIEGELRCYCNESGCVTTGYICKSAAGRCFTAVEVRGETTHQTHGCLDSLPEPQRASCRPVMDVVSASASARANGVKSPPGVGSGGGGGGGLPLLLCCDEDMCNYREDLDVSIILTPKFNGTFQRGSAPANTDKAVYSRNHPDNRDDERDLWFKAAVIAVPIAGGFILVLLVLLAVRMLKTDSRQHRRLIQIRRERSLTKAHMYITDHLVSMGKGSKQQHCSLFNEKTNTTTCVPVFSDSSGGTTVIGLCPSCCGTDISATSQCSCSRAPRSESSYVVDSGQTDSKCSCSCSSCGSNSSSNNTSNSNSNHFHHCNSYRNSGGGSSGPFQYPPPADISDKTSPPQVTCSINSNSILSSASAAKPPRSFFSDPPPAALKTTSCASRDINVRLVDRGGHLFPQVGISCPRAVGGVASVAGHTHSSVASWDKACSKGPMANV